MTDILTFFQWVLSTSVMATVLVGLILLMKLSLKGKLSPKWHYMLWLLLIIRLILPWSPESSFSVFNLLTFTNKQESNFNFQSMDFAKSLEDSVPEEIKPYETDRHMDSQPSSDKADLADIHGSTSYLSLFLQCSALVWLMGILILSAKVFLANRKFELTMRNETKKINSEIEKTYNICKKILFIKASIPIVLSDKVSSPTLWGILHPKIIIPKSAVSKLTSDELRYILLHELIHLKRKDIAINWIMNALLILHWFNPVLWYAYSRMREDQEIACDAVVLNCIERNESEEYARTIIKLMEHISQPLQFPGLARISGSKKQLRRRIIMIKLFKKNTFKLSLLGVAVAALLSVVALTNAKGESLEASQFSEESTAISKDMVVKMLGSSLDHFTTVKGKFIDSASKEKSAVEFQVREGEQPASYLKSGAHEVIFTNGYLINKINGKYETLTYIGPPPQTPDEKKLPKTEQPPRRDPANSGIAETIVVPEQQASEFLKVSDLWQIIGEGSLLGRPVIQISGDLPSELQSKYDAEKFTMWIDKETGMLLKRELYNRNGEVTSDLTVLEIAINPKLDESLFYISKTDFEELYGKRK
ncbi:hypothetical protein N0M98_33275 [Paenibacillus doosanensis]|uniref:M56 family metallopeptidase n=1 Tax=Paenibacillus doosanensis TaxID=1229154 RepID=UPI00217FE25D|nr:M56 family metallopeptidase [Paenibacillus doosanensis]MCS7464956.1 hypothetical protein [Paenibacillus doosanensis]